MSGLSWAPVDSTTAREIRERELEERADDQARQQRHHDQAAAVKEGHLERCRDGWLGEDDDGRPIPCLQCRPALAEVCCRTCSVPASTCQAQRHDRGGPCCDYCDHRRAAHRRPGVAATLIPQLSSPPAAQAPVSRSGRQVRPHLEPSQADMAQTAEPNAARQGHPPRGMRATR